MIPNSWLVILDDGHEREELILDSCPGPFFTYQKKWRATAIRDLLHIAVYVPTSA